MIKDKIDLESKYEARGSWHISGYPEDSQMGIFTFDRNKGSYLSLFNSFRQDSKSEDTLFDIQGHTLEGKCITLLNCFWIHKRQKNNSIFQPVTFRVTRALIGDQIEEDYKADSFYSVELSHHLIEEWMGDLPFVNKFNRADNSYTATYHIPECLSFDIPSIDSKVTIGREGVINHGDRKTMLWTSQGIITITPSSPKPLEWYSTQAHCLRQLLSFLIGEPARTRYFTLRGEEIEYSSKLKIRSSTHLLFQEIGLARSSLNDSFHEMFAPLPSIDHKVESIFTNWFTSHSKLRMPITLYLSAQAGDYTYVDTTLIALAQALEGFCRSTSDSHYLDKIKYKKILDDIVSGFPSGIPSDLRDRLKSMLTHGNEYSLKKRLKEEIKLYPPMLTDHISHSPSTFIDNIVDYRNAKIHVTHDKLISPIPEDDVFNSGLRMEIFFAICMMRILGFSEDEMDSCIKQSKRFRTSTLASNDAN